MNDVLITLLAWIGMHTGYDVDIAPPNIVMLEPYHVCVSYGIRNRGQCEAAKLKGFYNKAGTIYLHNDFDIQDPNDRSRLIHELVHYVQWANHEHKTTCLGHLEVEAYELQDEWRIKHNLASVLDPFKQVMLEASCDA